MISSSFWGGSVPRLYSDDDDMHENFFGGLRATTHLTVF